MVAVALALFLVSSQEAPSAPAPVLDEVTVALPPAPLQAPAAEAAPPRKILPEQERASTRRLGDRPEPESPKLGGFLLATGVVLALLAGTFLLLRRFGARSRFFAGGGVVNVLARKPLGPKQDVLLIEVGRRVYVVGSTRERMATLGEINDPEEVAELRSNLPGRKEESVRRQFSESLREGLREEEKPAEAVREAASSLTEELAEIKKTVQSWRG